VDLNLTLLVKPPETTMAAKSEIFRRGRLPKILNKRPNFVWSKLALEVLKMLRPLQTLAVVLKNATLEKTICCGLYCLTYLPSYLGV
jgi:hypothetical protein